MSLYYLDRLHQDLKNRADAGRQGVAGMPTRRSYAADQGWDELLAASRPAASPERQGAMAYPPVKTRPIEIEVARETNVKEAPAKT
jgi:hypothetical protein